VPQAAIEAVVGCLESGWLGTGPLTEQFEHEFAEYIGIASAAAVSSCTSGLFLALLALDIGPGDEVITTSMTFCSTVNAILHTGATPVLVDVDPESKNISVEAVARAITPKTKAILPVHYAGYPVSMLSLVELARDNDLRVVEDCAHAVETLVDGKHAGTFGDAAVFSFYATKNLAIGEGGMVVSKSSQLTGKVAELALHGLSRGAWQRFSASGRKTYDITTIGYKANLTDLQAAIGIFQLRSINQNYQRRTSIWNYYLEELASSSLELPNLPSGKTARHAKHLFAVGLPQGQNRDEFVQRAGDELGVSFGIHYKAISQFRLYQDMLHLAKFQFPVAEVWGSRCVSLSISPRITDNDVERVVSATRLLLK
jgi:dTDP-4-amino-4,6-dideoxygalactose transaminase